MKKKLDIVQNRRRGCYCFECDKKIEARMPVLALTITGDDLEKNIVYYCGIDCYNSAEVRRYANYPPL